MFAQTPLEDACEEEVEEGGDDGGVEEDDGMRGGGGRGEGFRFIYNL